jgi:hypothetical protein
VEQEPYTEQKNIKIEKKRKLKKNIDNEKEQNHNINLSQKSYKRTLL